MQSVEQKVAKYYYCPDCKKKGVYLKLAAHGEDNWRCKYCEFYFFAAVSDFDDIRNQGRFLDENHLKEMP